MVKKRVRGTFPGLVAWCTMVAMVWVQGGPGVWAGQERLVGDSTVARNAWVPFHLPVPRALPPPLYFDIEGDLFRCGDHE